MALCTSDEVATAMAQDSCPISLQADQDDKSTCRSQFTSGNNPDYEPHL